MTKKERLKSLLAKINASEGDFEKKAGLAKGAVSNFGENPRTTTLNKIKSAYPEINITWLLTEEGDMLIVDSKDYKEDGKNQSPKDRVNDNIDESLNDVPRINYTKGVPYYNVDFIGGFDLILNDQTTIPEYLIDFKKYNDATCWCNVTGHSMEPEINHGDIIALKKIEDPSFLPLGEVYAIITTNDMRTIKRLGAGKTDDAYTLVPSNKSPEYSPQQLPVKMIRTIFQVLGSMKRF